MAEKFIQKLTEQFFIIRNHKALTTVNQNLKVNMKVNGSHLLK